MKFCGLTITTTIAVTSCVYAIPRKRGNNNNNSNSLFNKGDLRFFLNHQDNQGLKRNICTPNPNSKAKIRNSEKCNCDMVERGIGRALIRGFSFNKETNECEDRIWGGGPRNSVNWFKSKKGCQQACVKVETEQQESNINVILKFGGGPDLGNCSPNNPNSKSNPNKCSCVMVEQGMGRALIRGYSYNSNTKSCEQRIWGGGSRNSINWFSNEADCTNECGQPSVILKFGGPDLGKCSPNNPSSKSNQDICACPMVEQGMGRALIRGYSYNSDTKSCEQRIWGGGSRNSINWFSNEADCTNQCVKQPDVTLKFGFGFGGGSDIEPDYDCMGEMQFSGMCRAMMTRYSYNVETGTCQEQLYGGCGGYTTNSFPTIESCNNKCVSSSQSSSKPIDRNIPTTDIFSKNTDEDYSDNFSSSDGIFLDDFLQKYSEEFQDDINLIFGCSDDNPCACPKNVGRPGFGQRERRFYYSSIAGKCIGFWYKGFGGNQNNFGSMSDCNNRCLSTAGSDDSSSSNSAPKGLKDATACHDRFLGDMINSCRALMFRWSYNSINNQCERVIWGGCDSFFGAAMENSNNNFATEDECKQTCKFEGIIHGNNTPFMGKTVTVNQVIPVKENNQYEPEERCTKSFNDSNGNGINNMYYIFDNSRNPPRCRKVSYSEPVLWFNKNNNLFPRFIDCRKACQPELFEKKKNGRGLKV